MRIFLITIFSFAAITAISPLTFAKEPIKLRSASDFNQRLSTMNPSAPTQANGNDVNNKIAPTNTAPTQNSVPYSPSTLSTPPATAVAPSTITTPSSTASPSNVPATGSGVLLGPNNNSSKNAAPGAASSWLIH